MASSVRDLPLHDRVGGREGGTMSDLLERQLYTVGEAARLLRLPSSKLRRWLEGFTTNGRFYEPVIRPAPTGSDVVTWAEFVEAGFLREYRARRVSLQYLRPVIDEMRKEFKVRYPLAHFKPLVDIPSRQLVLGIQQATHLDDDLALLVRLPSGQLQWAAAVQAFIDKVEFDAEGVVERMHPLGKASPVIIDPEVTFGVPQVKGIRTEIIAETYAEAGSWERVARDWHLSVEDVQAALQWELTSRKAA
jgi:uncharacterized protein (DUF433 family)